MSHPASRSASGASSPHLHQHQNQHHVPPLMSPGPVSPRPPSGPRSAVRPQSGPRSSIRPQSAMRMGLLAAVTPASSATASSSGSASARARQPWAGHLTAASPSVQFMARHSSGGGVEAASGSSHATWVTLDPKRAAALTAWIEQASAFLRDTTATATSNRAAISSKDATAAATNNAAAISNDAAVAATPDTLPPSALEGLSLSLTVRLLPNLAHHSVSIRSAVAHLILKLAAVFDEQAVGRNALVDEILATRAAAAAAAASVSSSQQSGIAAVSRQQSGIKRAASTTDATRQSTTAPASAPSPSERMSAIVDHMLAEPDLSLSLRLFFELMGRDTLAPLVLSIVERLESLYTHGSPVVRDAAILISGALMSSHVGLFRAQGEREGLVGVWNLFFMLDWMSGGGNSQHASHAEARGGGSESLAKLGGGGGGGSSDPHLSLPRLPLAGSRVSVIESLGLVCLLYVDSNSSLALQIVSRLLRLPEKTSREIRAIKASVLAIGNRCIERAMAISSGAAAAAGSNSVAASAVAAANASRAASPALDNATSFAAFSAAASAASAASSPAATAASYSLYPTLLSTLSAHREEHLDLLGWATFAYTINVQNAQWNLHMSGGSSGAAAAARGGSAAASAVVHAPRPILTDSRDVDSLYFSSGSGSGGGGLGSGRSGPLLRPSVEYPMDTLLRESSTLPVSLPVELSEFLSSLESHLRASPPLIRLGAAQALQALLTIYPSVLAWGAASSVPPAAASSGPASAARQALLFPHIVWGCADESHAVAATYLAILADIARGVGNQALQRAIVRYQSSICGSAPKKQQQTIKQGAAAARSLASMPGSVRGSPQSSRPASSGSHASASIAPAPAASESDNNEDSPSSLLSVLSLAISLAPPVPSRFLAFVLNSLGGRAGAAAGSSSASGSASQQMLLLQLVSEWSRQIQEVEPVFVAKLLPILMGEEAEITAASAWAATDDMTMLDSAAVSSASTSLSWHPFAPEMSCTVLRILKRLCPSPLHASLAPHHLLALTAWAMGVLARAPGTELPSSEGAAAEESMDDDPAPTVVRADPLSRHDSQALEQRILALLDLLHCLPLERLPPARIEALLSICLGRLLHSPSSAVRAALFSFLSSAGSASGTGTGSSAAPKWLSTKQRLSRACAILLAGLGDVSPSNVSLALSGLLSLISQLHWEFASSDSTRDGRHCLLAQGLRKAREGLLSARGLLERLVAYDALARCFAMPTDSSAQVALASIRECVTSAEFAPFASRLLSSVSSAAGAAMPSLYAHWWALLLTHCGHSVRRTVPVLLLLPLLGVSADAASEQAYGGSAAAVIATADCDESMRAATAHTIKRACILVGGLCHERLVADLVSTVLPRMLDASAGPSRNATGYHLMAVLAPLRLKGLCGFLVRRYLPPALQLLPAAGITAALRRNVLLCVESWVMLHPKLCFPYLENLRNALREMLCHGSNTASGGGGGGRGEKPVAATSGSHAHLTLLARVYTLVCFTSSLHTPLGSDSSANHYFDYLRADLAALSGAEERATFGANPAAAGASTTSDPLLSSLTSSQLRIVTLASLQALGSMDGPASRALAPAAMDELLRFLAHRDSATRYFAAEALAIQMGLVAASSPNGAQQIALAKWALLPLIADPDPAVRVMVVAGCGLGMGGPAGAVEKGVMNPARRRMARMMPEEDDAFEAAVTTTPTAELSASSTPAKPSKTPKGKKGSAAAASASAAAAEPAPTFVLPQGTVADSGVDAILSRVDSEDPWYAEGDECILGVSSADLAAQWAPGSFAIPSITPSFHRHLSSLIRSRIEVLPSSDRFDELWYLLGAQSLAMRGSQVPGVVALVLGELCTSNLGVEWGQRCEGVVKSILLSLEAPVTPLSKSLIFGSVLALQALACSKVCRTWDPELQPVPMLFAHLGNDDSSGVWLREGQLVGLAAIVSEPKVELAKVRRQDLEQVTQKLMRTLKDGYAQSLSTSGSNGGSNGASGSDRGNGASGSDRSTGSSGPVHSTPRAQQLALEILASLCEKVDDPSTVSTILSYLFEILAGSADPLFHESCSLSLRKLVAKLPGEHALLHTFAAALAVDVRSPRLESRLRALTTLVILGSRLPAPQRTQSFLRLLADPDRSVKHHTLAVLLNPSRGGEAEATALGVVVKAMIRETQQQTHPSPSSSPQPGASSLVKKGPLLAAKKPNEARRSGSAAGSSSTRDMASSSLQLDDLSDPQLLRLAEDVSDFYERRVASDTVVAAGSLRGAGHSSSTASAVQAPSIPEVSGASALDATRPLLSIPLPDSDPFNLRLLRSPGWGAILRAYGLPASATAGAAAAGMGVEEWERHASLAGGRDLLASFQQLTATSGPSASASSAAAPVLAPDADTDSPTMLDRLPASKRLEIVAMVRAKQVAHMGFAPLVSALLRMDGGKTGESVVAELMALFQALSKEEEEAIDAAVAAAASASVPPAPGAQKTTKSFVLGASTASTSAAAASDSVSEYPPLDLVSKLHSLGVALNILAGFRCSASAASVAAGGGAAAAFVSNAAQAEREAFSSKLAAALSSLQAAGSRFKSYAESLRARSLRALSNLTAFRAPGSATKWRTTATPRSERDFQRREAYINVVMNQPVDEAAPGTKSKQAAGDDAMPQTKQGLLEMQRDLERDMNDWATQLGRVTTLQLAVIRSISKLLSPARTPPTVSLSPDAASVDPVVASATFLWLGAMFTDTHRAVRACVREGIVGLVASQCSVQAVQSAAVGKDKPNSATSARASPTLPATSAAVSESPFLLQVQRSIYTLFHSLRDGAAPPATIEGGHLLASSGPSTSWLYTRRARADLVYLLGRLVSFSAHSRLRSETLWALVGLWGDSDPTVRAEAIDAVQAMLRDRVPETRLEAAEAPVTGDKETGEATGATSVGAGAGSRASPSLMKAILGRLRVAEYADKEKLSQLLNRFFVA